MAADPTPAPSFDTAPRLQSTAAPDPASAYAPIAWSAVAALAIGGLFVALFLALRWTTFTKNEPLVAPWLFVLPVVGIIVAFIARRQIAASEGTRTGTQYANAGWWLCVVGGLVYAAYLGTLEYTIRADAGSQLRKWTEELPKIVPDAPDQPELFNAFYRTLPPQQRTGFDPETYAGEPNGAQAKAAREGMRSRYAPELLKFRQSQVVRQAARYGDECRFDLEGVRKWEYLDQGKKIDCSLTATMRTPEGDFPLVVPMEAAVSRGNREWRVSLLDGAAGGYPQRTHYGFLVARWVPESAHIAAGEFLAMRQWLALQPRLGEPAFVAGMGPMAALAANLPPSPITGFAANPVVTLSGGGTPPEEKVREFRDLWDSPTGRDRFLASNLLGEGLLEDPSVPVFEFSGDRLMVKAPVQYQPRDAQQRGAGVRMRLVMECTDATTLAELKAARGTAATDPRTPDLPKDSPILKLANIPLDKWKLLRFESDFQVVRPPTAGGPPSGMGG